MPVSGEDPREWFPLPGLKGNPKAKNLLTALFLPKESHGEYSAYLLHMVPKGLLHCTHNSNGSNLMVGLCCPSEVRHYPLSQLRREEVLYYLVYHCPHTLSITIRPYFECRRFLAFMCHEQLSQAFSITIDIYTGLDHDSEPGILRAHVKMAVSTVRSNCAE